MITRTIAGVTLYIGSKYEMEKEGWNVNEDCRKMDNSLYLFTRGMTIDELARVAGLKVYVCAVPQEWYNQYFKQHGEAPKAVWCYDVQKTFGCPVTASEMFRILDCAISLTVPYRVEELES